MLDISKSYITGLKDHEHAMGDLYIAFSIAVPFDSTFWKEIAREEFVHVKIVAGLAEKMEAGELVFARPDYKLKEVMKSLHWLRGMIKDVQEKGIKRLEALEIARKLESSIIEHSFFEVFEGDPDEVRENFEALRTHTEKHLAKVQEKR